MGVNLNLIRNFQRQSVHPVGFEPVSAELLARIVRNIVESVAPEKIILFGSYAYGNATDDSDLDILVIMVHHQQMLGNLAQLILVLVVELV